MFNEDIFKQLQLAAEESRTGNSACGGGHSCCSAVFSILIFDLYFDFSGGRGRKVTSRSALISMLLN